MTAGRKVASVAGVAAVVYGAWVRPRLMRWGATDEEVAGPYPGAELVPGGEISATMAVTIDALPDQVWPWLVQMGWGHGGWYSWDRLNNGSRRAYSTHDSIDSQASVWAALMPATTAGLGRTAAAGCARSARGRHGLHGGGRCIRVAGMGGPPF